jgi:hypothetical protein
MSLKQNNFFIKLLKKHTNIDTEFINTFFSKFKIGNELNFDIKDNVIAKYLDISLITLRKRLQNQYSQINHFIENVDFIKVKTGTTSGVTYLINYPCFEKIAMGGDSKKSEIVRVYFTKLRQFLIENQKLIYNAMENKTRLNKFTGFEAIYFFIIDDRNPDIFKIGRTVDIIKRLRNYNVGRIKEIDLKYYALVKKSVIIERCMKAKLHKNQFIEDKEIYKIEANEIKKIIDDCYCKNISKKINNKLHEEVSNLLGLYSYSKNDKNLSPYIIIDRN